MSVIWKYPAVTGSLEMPHGAEILSLQVQAGQPTFWAKINNPHAERKMRQFVVVGTGRSFPDHYVYIGTWQDGEFVWHLFEIPL